MNLIKHKFALLGMTAALTLPVAMPAVADPAMYAGGGLGMAEIGNDNDVTMPYGRLGMYINQNFSGEVRAGFGLDDDGVELDSMLGAYVRGGIPMSSVFFPYAIVGLTRADFSYDNGPFSGDDDEIGLSMGVGADFRIDQRMAINAEYMSYLDDDDADLDALSVGLAVNF